jgi:pimeloyl-ACP methyl ester carboxylesterase
MVKCIALAVLLAAANNGPAQTGDWTATADFGLVKLRLALHLQSRPDDSWSATADSIDQDAFGLTVSHLRHHGSDWAFEVPRLGGRFAGTISEDGSAMEGRWTQHGGSFPLRFERGNIRPQETAPPYPYAQEEVAYRNGRVRLAGTLTLPPGAGTHPAVLLITGSGPQDRNDTVSGHRPFLVWADFLTRHGFAVLRVDDRGVGGSTGKLLDSTDEDFAADALAGVEFLKRRAEVDPKRIGLMGHSEGAVVAPMAAVRGQGIAFLVLLAGPAVPGDRILEAQSRGVEKAMGIPDEVAGANRQIQTEVFAIARAEPDGAAARSRMKSLLASETARLSPEAAAVIRGQVGSQIRMASSRWFRFVLNYDPGPTLGRVTCPVLALYGSLDLQVPAALNAPEMERLLAGNANHQVTTLPDLNHMFQKATTGSPLEYSQIEETVAPEVLKLVGEWMQGTGQPR